MRQNVRPTSSLSRNGPETRVSINVEGPESGSRTKADPASSIQYQVVGRPADHRLTIPVQIRTLGDLVTDTNTNHPRGRDLARGEHKRTGWTALRVIQLVSLILGVGLIGFYLAAKIDAFLTSRNAIDSMNRARTIEVAKIRNDATARDAASGDPVDTTLWSEQRVDEFQQSLMIDWDLPLAVLKIPVIDLEVPVFDGTDDLVLNRGAGWIEGTALPGKPGNSGIAAHRDGFFRELADVELGDDIIVETIDSSSTYVIEDIRIVDPTDVWVLEPTDLQSITLVTCYPFYFVGSAPQRYIVRAALEHRSNEE